MSEPMMIQLTKIAALNAYDKRCRKMKHPDRSKFLGWIREAKREVFDDWRAKHTASKA